MIEETTIDPWSRVRNFIGFTLIVCGVTGIAIVFWMLFKLLYGMPQNTGLMAEIQKILSGDSALFVMIAAETGTKKIELSPAFVSLAGLFFYVMVLGMMGKIAQGTLSSGLELMQADIRKLKYLFESKNQNNQTPSV